MKSGEWTWLELAKITLGVLTPISIFILSFLVDSAIRDREAIAKRDRAIRSLSEDIYERRVRAILLASGLRRHASEPVSQSMLEIIERKSQYDQSFVRWNEKLQANLLVVREFLNTRSYTALESIIEFHLVAQGFNPVDACLTHAYDESIRGRDAIQVLDACAINEKLNFLLDCGYSITDELFRISGFDDEQSHEEFYQGAISRDCGAPEIGMRFRGYASDTEVRARAAILEASP